MRHFIAWLIYMAGIEGAYYGIVITNNIPHPSHESFIVMIFCALPLIAGFIGHFIQFSDI